MPFYQFNKFTGRLQQSTHSQPFYPIAPHTLQNVDPPVMIYGTPNTEPAKVRAHGSRLMSTVSPKVLETMKKFQADLHAPVYLLNGRKDKFLWNLTAVLVGASTLYTYYGLFKYSATGKI